MQRNEDVFTSRLRDMANGQDGRTAEELRARAMRSLSHRQMNERQNSVLLPMVAVCSLLLGGAAFASMVAMPNPMGDAFAQTTLENRN